LLKRFLGLRIGVNSTGHELFTQSFIARGARFNQNQYPQKLEFDTADERVIVSGQSRIGNIVLFI
jgi:hypothetical protein